MDVARFLRELPSLFDDYPCSEHPRDRRFRRVLDEVPGLATESCLALLNLAAACLDPGEAYVEAGSFRGTSLVAAGLGNDVTLVGIDRFSMEGSDRATLEANLARFGVSARIVEGEVQQALSAGELEGVRIGVFYYDAEHTRDALLGAFRLVEPLLAASALIVVDDSDWERVGESVAEYLAGEQRARLVVDLKGKRHGAPQWWEGVQVLAWRGGVSALSDRGTTGEMSTSEPDEQRPQEPEPTERESDASRERLNQEEDQRSDRHHDPERHAG